MRRPAIGLVLLLCSPGGFAAATDLPNLADCEEQIRADATSLDGYDCLAGLPRNTGNWGEARTRLEAYVAADPGNHLARFALGALESSQGRDRAEKLLRDAADGLARTDRPVEEVRARLTLAVFYFIRGRSDDAEPELELAEQVAATTGDPVLQARVLNIQGRAASQENDLDRAWTIFKRVESMIIPEGPPEMQAFCLAMLGVVSEQLGRYDRALGYHRRAAKIQHAMGDYWAEARSRSNLAQYATLFWGLGEMEQADALAMAREALDAAVRAGTRSAEARMRIRVAELLDDGTTEAQLHQALAIARELRDVRGIDMGLRALALQLASLGRRDEAQVHLDELLRSARHNWERDREARALLVQAGVQQESGEIDEAIETYRRAIDVIESIRDLQEDDVIQARFFSQWVTAYRRLFGLLLGPEGTPPTDLALEEAFAVSERMRARALLDALDGAGATAALAPAGAAAERREALLGEISELQRRLVEGEISTLARTEILQRLGETEAEEEVLRAQVAAQDERFGRLRRPEFPGLWQVQASLAEDQALLAFQVARRENRDRIEAMGRWGGGSWLLVITRTEARAHPLPDRLVLEAAVRGFLGLVERRDGAESAAASELHRQLLGNVLFDLPEPVTELVVIPDGILHHLPFSVLRPENEGTPLGLRYRITRAPSAAAWLRLREIESAPPEAPAVVVADPPPPGNASTGAAATRSWALTDELELGALPHARREARLLGKRLGPRSLIRLGSRASEHFVKHAELATYALFHVAAHAVVDDDNPWRSAIVLAPGVEEEDGLLQIREVIELDLTGRLVTLSACRTVSGELLQGEGLMGLARAFFQAGARTVVGSLWPLRDDEAAAFFEAFYEPLSRGATVAAALQEARQARAADGAPASAWAGIVLLGDGGLRPFPDGAARVSEHGGLLVMAAASLVAIALFVALLARRRPHAPVAD